MSLRLVGNEHDIDGSHQTCGQEWGIGTIEVVEGRERVSFRAVGLQVTYDAVRPLVDDVYLQGVLSGAAVRACDCRAGREGFGFDSGGRGRYFQSGARTPGEVR